MTDYRSVWKYLFKVPHRLAWVDVNGVSTRYIELGKVDGPVVILLHGTAGSLENFCANFEAYAREFRVYAIDMIGCGLTGKPDYPYTAKVYARHVKEFMDAMGIETASFVGVSLGSWIASRLAFDFPGRADRLVSIAPAGIIPDRAAFDAYTAGVRQRRGAAAGAPTWESITEIFSHLLHKREDIIDDLVAVRLEIYQNPEMQRAMPNLLAMTTGEESLTEEEWAQLPNPILTVCAVDKDDMFQGHARKIAEIAPNAQMVEMTGCDHWAQFEQPELFNAVSIAFLKGLPVPARVEASSAARL